MPDKEELEERITEMLDREEKEKKELTQAEDCVTIESPRKDG